MNYKYNNRTIVIPDGEIDNLVDSLKISQQEAIDLWLSDNNIEENEEQAELDEKASKVHILKDIEPKNAKKPRKTPVRKVSDEKKELFNEIFEYLSSIYGENVKILNNNKLISVDLGDENFKINLIQTRKPKKTVKTTENV